VKAGTLDPADFQASAFKLKFPVGVQLNAAGDAFQRGEVMLGYAEALRVMGDTIGLSHPDKGIPWMEEALRMARTAYALFEEQMLMNAERNETAARSPRLGKRWGMGGILAAELAGHEPSMDLFGSSGEDVATEKLVIDTATHAVHFSDEHYLAMVQEHCFGLGTSQRVRSGLANYLYDVLPVPAAKDADSRLKATFAANSPFLFLRASVLDKTAIRHSVTASRLGGNKVESLDTGRDSDRRPLGPDGDWHKNLALDVCSSLSENDWSEIASRVDARTAEELKAWRAGQLTPKIVGEANYRHFYRQMEGPSVLRWLIVTRRKTAGVVAVRSRWGPQPTSYCSRNGLTWDHVRDNHELFSQNLKIDVIKGAVWTPSLIGGHLS
jgi:hypothetical protein